MAVTLFHATMALMFITFYGITPHCLREGMSASSASSETLQGDEAKRGRSTSPFIMAAPRSRSPEALARIRVKNRRKRYLDTHPEYFSSNLELAGLRNCTINQLSRFSQLIC